jgi:hypothetical protein
MIRKKYLAHVESMYPGLTQPIVGTGSAVVKVTGADVGRTMQVESNHL